MELSKKDVLGLISIVKVNYPFAYKVQDAKNPNGYTTEDTMLLADVWHDGLKEYPKAVVLKAFNTALKVCKIAITLADIVEQVTKIQSAFEPSANELWGEFRQIIKRAAYEVSSFGYTAIDRNGLAQGENARMNVERLYEKMRPELKRYCGSQQGLINIARKDDDALNYEESNFKRTIELIRGQTKLLADPLIQELILDSAPRLSNDRTYTKEQYLALVDDASSIE